MKWTATVIKKDVLVVEDDQLLNMVMSIELAQIDELNIRTASNGRQALSAIKEQRPDLIILDVTLPGLSAFEIVQALKNEESLNKIPLIIHTSHDLSMEEQKDLELGPTVFMTKTRTGEELTDIVRKALGLGQ
ncbi:MAG: response regulator [Candidatus Obscuribacterales bacterium]|nr:response regulator [Candidatus Obscuribacterales bacterium]